MLRASPHAPGSVAKEEPSARSEDPVACTLRCSLTVLLDLAGGRIKPAAAYLRGLISVGGDRAVFMQLRGVLQAAVMEFKQEGMGEAGAVSVAVLGATVHAGPNERYAVYQLEVSEGADSWLLLRRWSELRALERAMAKLRPPGLAAAPRLPRWLDLAGSLEAPFLAERCGRPLRVRARGSQPNRYPNPNAQTPTQPEPRPPPQPCAGAGCWAATCRACSPPAPSRWPTSVGPRRSVPSSRRTARRSSSRGCPLPPPHPPPRPAQRSGGGRQLN